MRLVRRLVLIVVGLLVSCASISEANGRQLMTIDVNAADIRSAGRKSQVPLGAIVSSSVVHDRGAGGGMVTVTTYHNNGLWHRIQRWWKRLIGREEPLGSAKERDMESRSGAEGTFSMSDNEDGGGTLTWKVFNNEERFQHIQKQWQRALERETQRLRKAETGDE